MAFVIQNQDVIIGVLFSTLGIIVSIYLYFVGKKYRQIAYTCETLNVSFENNPIGNVKINPTYNEKEIKNLLITDLIIWSKGREVINSNDVAPKCPLTIHMPCNAEILEYQVVYQNELANNFNLSLCESNDCIIIDFDYLSHKNAIALRVIHTNNCNGQVSVDVTLKDGKSILHVSKRKGFLYKILNHKYVKNIISSKLTSLALILFTLVLFPIAFIQSANNASNNFFGLPDDNIFMNIDSIIIFTLCTVSFIFTIPHIYNLFKTEPPKDLLSKTSCEP